MQKVILEEKPVPVKTETVPHRKPRPFYKGGRTRRRRRGAHKKAALTQSSQTLEPDATKSVEEEATGSNLTENVDSNTPQKVANSECSETQFKVIFVYLFFF